MIWVGTMMIASAAASATMILPAVQPKLKHRRGVPARNLPAMGMTKKRHVVAAGDVADAADAPTQPAPQRILLQQQKARGAGADWTTTPTVTIPAVTLLTNPIMACTMIRGTNPTALN